MPDLRHRLAAHLPRLAPAGLAHVEGSVPVYEHLPADEVRTDLAQVVRQNLDLFARLLREGRAPCDGEVEFILHAAARRAEERIPLPDVVAAYFAGFRFFWQRTADVVEDDRERELLEVGSLVLTYLEAVTGAVAEGYVEASAAVAGQERDARSELLRAVLGDADEPRDWAAAGLAPWEERTVLVLHTPAPATRTDPVDEVAAAVEVRRRSRAVRHALAALSGAPVLDDLSPRGGTVVARGHLPPAGTESALRPVLPPTWVAALATAGAGAPTPGALAAAADTADVALRLGLPTGVHRLEDLLLEVQVTRPGPSRDALARLLAPLEDVPDLVGTVAAHVAAHGRRAEAARRLHVHPNTLDHRLRRIRELTGLDATDQADGQLLRAALVVRDYLAGGVSR